MINTIFIESKYNRLSINLFLSSSYPKTQPLVPSNKSDANQIFSTTHLPRLGKLNLPFVEPLLGPLLEW